MKVRSEARLSRGFTLLEIMVSVAILAVTIIPMLLLREVSYNKAIHTKALRVAQELAQEQLTIIALEVREGEGAGEFEGYPLFRYEYRVTLYDFGAGMEEGEEGYDDTYPNAPGDGVFPEEEPDSYGPLVRRHVELTLFYPSTRVGEEESRKGEDYTESEYVIDTYIPVLLTDEQYDLKSEGGIDEE